MVAAVAAAAAATAPQPRSVPLLNAAEPGMTMPLAGLGMPCGLGCPKV
jgi:hypothetical protein